MRLTEFRSRHLSPQERAAVDAAIAAGRVTHCPPAVACGLSSMEMVTGFVAPPFQDVDEEEQLRRTSRAQRAQAAGLKTLLLRRKAV